MSESKLSKVKVDYEEMPKQKTKAKSQKENKMSKKNQAPKTIKVKTLIIAAAVGVAIVASFVGGIITANNYNAKVTADAEALAEVMSKTEAR